MTLSHVAPPNQINNTLYRNTPEVKVHDNRGLTIRAIRYHRHPNHLNVTNERITRHHYNTAGYLTQSIDPRLSTPNIISRSTLTGQVLRTESVDAGSMTRLLDIAGRPILQINAMGVIRTWQYEAPSLPGRLRSITEEVPGEASKITERFVWAKNSHAEQAYNLAGTCIQHYDPAGLIQTNSIALTGTVLSISRQLLAETLEADWSNTDPAAWQTQLDPERLTTQSITDATGTLLTQTDAKGNRQRLAYDVAGMLDSSWLMMAASPQKEQPIIVSLRYSAAGQKQREIHGNGIVTHYQYEPQTQRLIGITSKRPPGHAAGARVLQDLGYTYDPIGNVVNVQNKVEETRFWRNQRVVPENTYRYDSLYQLVHATGRELANIGREGLSQPTPQIPLSQDAGAYTCYTRDYTYDCGGNLIQMQHNSPATGNSYTQVITVSSSSNRAVLSTLTQDPAHVESWFDAAGHQRALQPGQPLTWNTRGQLHDIKLIDRTSAAKHHISLSRLSAFDSDEETYQYDANHQRIIKHRQWLAAGNTCSQRVIYLQGLELRTNHYGPMLTESLHVLRLDIGGRAQVQVLYWEAGKPQKITNGQIRYSYSDRMGSPLLEVDSTGKVISQEEYYPYGGTAVWTTRSRIEAYYKTCRYTGKERDVTGLYYYGYRYYQPWAGRWLSADPAGTVDGLNLYRMVKNNPITLFDKNGLVGEDSFFNLAEAGQAGLMGDLTAYQRLEEERKRLDEELDPEYIVFNEVVDFLLSNEGFSHVATTASSSIPSGSPQVAGPPLSETQQLDSSPIQKKRSGPNINTPRYFNKYIENIQRPKHQELAKEVLYGKHPDISSNAKKKYRPYFKQFLENFEEIFPGQDWMPPKNEEDLKGLESLLKTLQFYNNLKPSLITNMRLSVISFFLPRANKKHLSNSLSVDKRDEILGFITNYGITAALKEFPDVPDSTMRTWYKNSLKNR